MNIPTIHGMISACAAIGAYVAFSSFHPTAGIAASVVALFLMIHDFFQRDK